MDDKYKLFDNIMNQINIYNHEKQPASAVEAKTLPGCMSADQYKTHKIVEIDTMLRNLFAKDFPSYQIQFIQTPVKSTVAAAAIKYTVRINGNTVIEIEDSPVTAAALCYSYCAENYKKIVSYLKESQRLLDNFAKDAKQNHKTATETRQRQECHGGSCCKRGGCFSAQCKQKDNDFGTKLQF